MSSGGSVRQRPNGTWEARYRVEGRQRSVYAKTKRAAQARLREAMTAADNGVRTAARRGTVAAYLKEWLEGLGAHVRPRTRASYEEACRLYINPHIGHIQLAKLQAEDINWMTARLDARGDLSSSTVRYSYIVLRIALGQALFSKRVVRNVALEVRPPKVTVQEHSPLSLEQVGTFLKQVEGDRLAALFKVAIGLGLRQGELLGLRWADIDIDAGTLTVRHARNARTGELSEPKTKRSRRTLRLGSELSGALRAHRVNQLEERMRAGRRWVDGDFVFVTPTGQSVDPSNLRRRFNASLKAAGLPHQRFHDLRHACATLLLEQGEELAVVSRILGHASLSTTANTYMHTTNAMLARAADRTDVILGRRDVALG